MSQTFKGNSCKNARIKIDYSGVKPDVTFSYPSKIYGTSPNGGMIMYIFMAWFVIWLIGFYAIGAHDALNQVWEPTSLEKFTTCRMEHSDINYSIILEEDCKDILTSNFDWKAPVGILLSLFLPPFIIYRPFRKKWNNIYPKLQGWMAKKKVMKFKPKDIRYDEQLGYFCEVPVFSNVILNYTATKEFSKYLKFFEIEEFKFKYLVHKHKSKKKLSKSHKKHHRKRALNEWIWYARFYFKDKPQNGQLEVIFK
jgi:hypothetical protein